MSNRMMQREAPVLAEWVAGDHVLISNTCRWSSDPHPALASLGLSLRAKGIERMCFSASASFVAGVSLTAIGVATVRKAEGPAERPFAMIPLLFGIQQLTEGVIWLTF